MYLLPHAIGRDCNAVRGGERGNRLARRIVHDRDRDRAGGGVSARGLDADVDEEVFAAENDQVRCDRRRRAPGRHLDRSKAVAAQLKTHSQQAVSEIRSIIKLRHAFTSVCLNESQQVDCL